MYHAGRRPMGRLFYWAVAIVLAPGIWVSAAGSPQGGVDTTIIADTVYLADGTAASGNVIITWPAFVSASGAALAAGNTSVTLGANGALSVALVPNEGASPAGVYYTVVYQLGPGQVKTEYWVVPTVSPANLATVRTTPGSGLAGQPVSMQYVNSGLATKANDSAVVHLNGAETISGAKTFASSPTVPAPTNSTDIATKAYVDASVTGVGSGSYLSTAGGTLTGPLTLPGNPASMIAPATVLFDDVVGNAPAFCTYALVNAANLQCSIAYTYAAHISLAMVRTALPDSPYSTKLVESLSDGGQCRIAGSTTLDFYPQYVPALNTLIVASYRGAGRAVAEIANRAGIAELARENDDGVRGLVRTMRSPSARTQVDCENAALAILDDAGETAWKGTYETWSDFLPGTAEDIFPGDGVGINVPSQNAGFSAIVRTVNIQWADPAGDRGNYTIEFANDWASPLAMQDEEGAVTIPLHDLPPRLSTEQVGAYYLASLTDAQVTSISSTTVEFDVGLVLANGLGVEVRMHDYGWGPGNDRNLVGRYNTQTFSVSRMARTQNYFLRLYDSSSPPRYSRYAAALHVDYPL
ncbi:MAG TPA: hypothetical protein VE866_17950 [Candidatus Binatia bacterium]|nr:hypothetical protein [Candidatus Binatia bacterium]